MCYYEKVIDEKKDVEPLIKSKEIFQLIINRYPNTDFALDSRVKLDLIFDILASKEMYVGKYYLNQKKWIPAINRFRTIIEKYPTTIYVEEALHRLVEVYYIIGLEEESKKYANVLGYNYLSSQWYEQSYKVFNKDYKTRETKEKKKKDNFIKRKIKKLFD